MLCFRDYWLALLVLLALTPLSGGSIQIEDDGNDEILMNFDACSDGSALFAVVNSGSESVFVKVDDEFSNRLINLTEMKPGITVVAVPGTYFTDDTDIVIETNDTDTFHRTVIVNLPFQGLLVEYEPVAVVNEDFLIYASVSEGTDVSFSLDVRYAGDNTTYQMSVFTPCNKSLSTYFSFTPDTDALYFVEISATSRSSNSLVETFYVQAYYPIPAGTLTPLIGPHFPDDSLNFEVVAAAAVINKPTAVNCTVDWGDGTDLFEIGIDLGTNDPLYTMYTRSHIWLLPGFYNISILCINPVSNFSESEEMNIENPVMSSVAYLEQPVIPFSHATQQAKALLVVKNTLISRTYRWLDASIDFGLLNVAKNITVEFPDSRLDQTYPEKGNYTIGVTISAFNVSIEYVLQLRVGVMDIFLENHAMFARINTEQTIYILRFSDDTMTLPFNYSPDEASVAKTNVNFPADRNEMTMMYTYSTPGMKTLYVDVTISGVTEQNTASFEVFAGCVSTSEFFEVAYRVEHVPMVVALSAVPTISGRAQPTELCNSTVPFEFRWNVSINTGLAPIYVWDPLEIVQPGAINLVQKNFITKPGLYRIQLSVIVLITGEVVTDTMFMEVVLPPIVADIEGGTFRQVVVGDDVTLNAEALSYDMAKINVDNVAMTFSWECFMLTTKRNIPEIMHDYSNDTTYGSNDRCPFSLPKQGIFEAKTSNLSLNSLALFRLTVTKDSRNDTAKQAVEIVAVQPPTVLMHCVWNCQSKMLRNQRTEFAVTIRCPDCSDEEIFYAQYNWTLHEYNPYIGGNREIKPNDWDPRIISSPTDKIFFSNGGWWTPESSYTLFVDVKVGFRPSGTASRVVFINSDPYDGTCSVDPLEGISGETEFKFRHTGWRDEGARPYRNYTLDLGAPLLYMVQQRAAVVTPLTYNGGEISSGPKTLGPCGTPDDYCTVDVDIKDMFSGTITCPLRIKVSSAALLRLAKVPPHQREETMREIIQEMLEEMKKTAAFGDPLKTAQEAALYSVTTQSLIKFVNYNSGAAAMNIANLSSPLGLPRLLDPESVLSPMGKAVSGAIGSYVKDIEDSYETAAGRGDIDDPQKILTYAKAMTAATSSASSLSGESLVSAADTALKMSEALKNQSGEVRTIKDLQLAADAIAALLGNIIEAAVVDLNSIEPDPNFLGNTGGLSEIEADYISDLVAKRNRFRDKSVLEKTPDFVPLIEGIWDNLAAIGRQVAHYDSSYQYNSSSYVGVVQKLTRKDIWDQKYDSRDNFSDPINSFSLGDLVVPNQFEPVHIQVLRSKNFYTHGSNSKFITSDIFIANVVRDNGEPLDLVSAAITHQTGEGDCNFGENLAVIVPEFIEEDAAKLFYHRFFYPDPNADVFVKVRPTAPGVFYRLYAKVGSPPTDLAYDYRVTMSHSDLQTCKEVRISHAKLKGSGVAYLGLRPFYDETQATTKSRRKRNAVINPLVSSYFFGVTTVTCYDWDGDEVNWVASRCTMTRGNGTVKCICNVGKKLIHGLSFNFSPNTVHFGTVFSKFDIGAQGPVLGVLLSIFFLFALLAVWAHYKDRKSVFKWGVFPLKDNYADEDYYYLITVHTGLRKSAGTLSNVSFCLSGELDETGVRVLSDGVRQGFSTGSVVHFVMAVPSCLGTLQCMRIWHDNSGKGKKASWYLDRVDVVDLQNGRASHFICEEWLTPEDSLDKIVEASSVKDLQTLRSMFFANTKKNLTDEHLWVSVFIRPERSRFSRVERTGCCLAFLLLAMITSAMFYRGAPDLDRVQPTPYLAIGPLRLRFQQLYYSIVAAIITAVPIIIIVTLFRKARTRVEGKYSQDSSGCCGRGKVTVEGENEPNADFKESSIWDNWTEELKEHGVIHEKSGTPDSEEQTEDKKEKKKSKGCMARMPWMIKLERQLEELEKILLIKPEYEEMKGTWPHWVRKLAWAVIAVAVLTCSFFVVLYSMQWGKDVSEDWLSTFFLSFLQSLFVVDPFKVIVMAILLSIFVKKAQVKGADELNLLHVSQVNREYGIKEKPIPSRTYVSYLSSMTDEEMKAATLRRKIHIMIRQTLREFAVHIVFLLIVFSLCFANRSPHDRELYKQVYQRLVEPKKVGFNHVNTTEHYFNWLENVVTPWLFPETDYQGRSIISEDRQYTDEWNLYRLGAPRMRQVRMKEGSCDYTEVESKDCIDEYVVTEEDTTEYCLAWNNTPCPAIDQLRVTAGAWYFQSALDIWGMPIAGYISLYGGGGYIQYLDINVLIAKAIIEELKENLWIDRRTRAVFLEFTLYCPNINHFTYVMLLGEFPNTGGVIPFVSIYPFTVYNPSGLWGTYILICEVLGIAFTCLGIFYVAYIFSKLKRRALKDFWFMVDVVALVVAICAVSLFSLRLSSSNRAIGMMKEDRTQFINYHQVMVWDMAFVICLGLLVAIGLFRLLKLAGYSVTTMKIYHVLRLAAGLLPSFFAYIFLILISFTFMAFVMFSRTSPAFKNFLASLETLFTGLLGHSGFKETNVPETERWMTICFFCLFVVIVVLCLTNLFLAILLDLLTVSAQSDCEAAKSDEAQIFSVLWDSLLRLFGRKRDPVDRIRKAASEPPKPEPVEPGPEVKYDHWLERLGRVLSQHDYHDGPDAILKWSKARKLSRNPFSGAEKPDLDYIHNDRCDSSDIETSPSPENDGTASPSDTQNNQEPVTEEVVNLEPEEITQENESENNV